MDHRPISSDTCVPAAGAKSAKTSHGRGATKPQDVQDAVRAQFTKTNFCHFYPDCRKGIDCPFAHGEQEMKPRPDLTKTSLCQGFLKGSCRLHSSQCRFAHGYTDIRKTVSMAKSTSASPKSSETKSLISQELDGHSTATVVSTCAASPKAKPMRQNLTLLQRKYERAQRIQMRLVHQMQEMEEAMDNMTAGSANAPVFNCEGFRTLNSNNPTESREMGVGVHAAQMNSSLASAGMTTSAFPQPETEHSHLHDLSPEGAPAPALASVQGGMWLMLQAVASDLSLMLPPYSPIYQGKMIEDKLLSASPDHYED